MPSLYLYGFVKYLKNQNYMQKKAFSLIELAIVLIIIGILFVGISQGGAMINSARLASARSATSNSPVPKISGLLAWYETSSKNSLIQSQTSESSQITTWYDISPDSIVNQRNTLTKAAATNAVYSVSGINKFPSIRFNLTGKFSISALYQGPTPQATVFMVFRPEFTPSSTQVIPFDANVANDRFSFGIKNDSININAGNGVDTGLVTNPASFAINKDYIVAVYFNSTSSSAYVNNAATMAGGSVINCGTNLLAGLSIGTDKNTNSGFTGLISEVIVYNRPLKLEERKDVIKYLAKKYKIAVVGA